MELYKNGRFSVSTISKITDLNKFLEASTRATDKDKYTNESGIEVIKLDDIEDNGIEEMPAKYGLDVCVINEGNRYVIGSVYPNERESTSYDSVGSRTKDEIKSYEDWQAFSDCWEKAVKYVVAAMGFEEEE